VWAVTAEKAVFAEKTAFAKGPGAKCWARQIAHAAGVPAVPANPTPISRGPTTKSKLGVWRDQKLLNAQFSIKN